MSKRNREVNWSNEEKMLLVEGVRKRRDVIENKSNELKIIRNKKNAWIEIHDEMKVNGFNRELSRIKEMWRRMKCCSKTEVATYKKLSKKTGGGSPPTSPNDISWAIKDICPDDFIEDTSRYDSDFILNTGNTEPTPEVEVENYILDSCTGLLTPLLPPPQPSQEISGVDISCPSGSTVPLNSQLNPSTHEPIMKRRKKNAALTSLTSFENEMLKLEKEKHEIQMNNLSQIHAQTLKNLENENERQEKLYLKALEEKKKVIDILNLKKEILEIELLKKKLEDRN